MEKLVWVRKGMELDSLLVIVLLIRRGAIENYIVLQSNIV